MQVCVYLRNEELREGWDGRKAWLGNELSRLGFIYIFKSAPSLNSGDNELICSLESVVTKDILTTLGVNDNYNIGMEKNKRDGERTNQMEKDETRGFTSQGGVE